MAKLACTYRQAREAAQRKVGITQRTDEWQSECWIDGRFQFKVTIPDGGRRANEPMPIGTLKSIIRQLRLDREQFERWRDCPLDREEYEEIIRALMPSSDV
jgi:hypothetical protein